LSGSYDVGPPEPNKISGPPVCGLSPTCITMDYIVNYSDDHKLASIPDVDSVEICQWKCVQHEKCVAFKYHLEPRADAKWCNLFPREHLVLTPVDPSTPNHQGIVSGPKICDSLM